MTCTSPFVFKLFSGCSSRTEKMQICLCRMPSFPAKQITGFVSMAPSRIGDGDILRPMSRNRKRVAFRVSKIRASVVDSQEGSSNFAKRIEQAWLISKQPRPIACTTCESNGNVECKWCAGTGFFILGNNMLCQVPSKNTSCVICSGKGSTQCSDCQGTGFRAKWLIEPPNST
ncbi:hypothetical protein V2J09_019167 [Rumex salicifolius]